MNRIGFSIAQRLAQSGATVLISSRKLANVERAVQQLKDEGLQSVDGLVCHVGNPDDRLKLVEYVKLFDLIETFSIELKKFFFLFQISDQNQIQWARYFRFECRNKSSRWTNIRCE